jgi:hypothetical protein
VLAAIVTGGAARVAGAAVVLSAAVRLGSRRSPALVAATFAFAVAACTATALLRHEPQWLGLGSLSAGPISDAVTLALLAFALWLVLRTARRAPMNALDALSRTHHEPMLAWPHASGAVTATLVVVAASAAESLHAAANAAPSWTTACAPGAFLALGALVVAVERFRRSACGNGTFATTTAAVAALLVAALSLFASGATAAFLWRGVAIVSIGVAIGGVALFLPAAPGPLARSRDRLQRHLLAAAALGVTSGILDLSSYGRLAPVRALLSGAALAGAVLFAAVATDRATSLKQAAAINRDGT